MSFAEKWVENLATIWMAKDIEAAVALFKNCTNYRETPFDVNSAAAPGGIRDLWQGVKSQSDIKVQTELRLADRESAVAIYRARYKMDGFDHSSSGVWIMNFEQDYCISFEQWFMADDRIVQV